MREFQHIRLQTHQNADGKFTWSVSRKSNDSVIATSGIEFSSVRLATHDFERELSMWEMLDRVIGEKTSCPHCGGKI